VRIRKASSLWQGRDESNPDVTAGLLRAQWDGGRLLAFSGLDGSTDFEKGLVVRTAFGKPGLDVKLPGECRILFPDLGAMECIVTGDCFIVRGANAELRGAFLDACHLLIEGPCEARSPDRAITVTTKRNRTLIASASRCEEAKVDADVEGAIRDRRRWLETLPLPSTIPASSRHALLRAVNLMKTQVSTPEGRIRHRWTTPDRWPHARMWLWDSVFHAIGWRHLDVSVARDAITAVFDVQRDDGFMPHMGSPREISSITQPPVLAFGVKLVNDVDPRPEWIEALYPKLAAYLEWDVRNRDTDGAGLVEWATSGDPHCRCDESGMDNSPRFDATTSLDAVDFNSFLALEFEVMSGFAAALGRGADSEKWKGMHSRLCALIRERFWSERSGFFLDYDNERRTHSPVLASSGFLPLICGAATEAQAGRLASLLRDPEMFQTRFPVSCIAKSDTQHYRKDMWRGPVWININWYVALGLDRYGMAQEAADLRRRTMEEIERFNESHGVFFEYYDDRREVDPPEMHRKGSCAPEKSPYHQVIHDYGWTATLYADMVFSCLRG